MILYGAALTSCKIVASKDLSECRTTAISTLTSTRSQLSAIEAKDESLVENIPQGVYGGVRVMRTPTPRCRSTN